MNIEAASRFIEYIEESILWCEDENTLQTAADAIQRMRI